MKNNWIIHPLTLSGENIELISLEENHFEQLEELAKEKRIWEFYTLDCSAPGKFKEIFKEAFDQRENGNQFPFVIFNKSENKLIGSTRFLEIDQDNKKLEIGWTWLHPDYWSTSINLECKILLLTYCFDLLHTVRVQLRTDENNLRSRKAIEKTGAKFEGIIRNDKIRENGTLRNSVLYSILDSEWNQTLINLNNLLQKKDLENKL